MSKQTPLPTSVTFGASSGPKLKSTSRGSSAAARPTAWISGKPRASNSWPTMLFAVDAVALGQRMNRGFERDGAEIIGGRVDEIACEADAVGHADYAARIDALRAHKLRGLRAGLLVARETVRGEQPRQGRGLAGVSREAIEFISARRQQRRQFARQERVGFRGICGSTPNSTQARAPCSSGSKRCAPALGSNPEAIAKAAAAGESVARRASQFSRVTQTIGTVFAGRLSINDMFRPYFAGGFQLPLSLMSMVTPRNAQSRHLIMVIIARISACARGRLRTASSPA